MIEAHILTLIRERLTSALRRPWGPLHVLRVDGRVAGRLDGDRAARLAAFDRVFERHADGLAFVPAQDGSFAWLFFTSPMPGGATITLHLDGDRVRAAQGGALLDADGDGTAGGLLRASFTTVGTAVAAATTVGRMSGRVIPQKTCQAVAPSICAAS